MGRDVPVSSSSSWPFVRLSLVVPCLSCTVRTRNGQRNPSVASPVLSRGKDHILQPAGNALPNVVQNTICLCGMSILSTRNTRSFCQAAFQQGGWQHVFIHGVFSHQMQDYAFPFLNFMFNKAKWSCFRILWNLDKLQVADSIRFLLICY